MGTPDSDLDRLLRAAAQAEAEAPEPVEAPFGFDTRVIAQWRAQGAQSAAEGWASFARFFRSVAVTAMVVAVSASAAAYWEFQQDDELTEPSSNAYAIADTAIEAGTFE